MARLAALLAVVALVLLALSFVAWPDVGAAVFAPTPDIAPAAVVTVTRAAPSPTATRPTATHSPADAGRVLFQTKGCTTCHRHEGLNLARIPTDGPADTSLGEIIGAPDLTHYQPNPDFVRQWLKDPRSVRPETRMPDLGLKEVEIETLLAFLLTNVAE